MGFLESFTELFNPPTPGGANRSFKPETTAVRFSDVAGCAEAKLELMEVVDFIKNRHFFEEFGAKIPKGVLLCGPPGNGKTLLAKAVAGESGVPFFAISGAEFVEMYVGVGAARVRKLFADASRSGQAAIIFIDEVDAAGKVRGSSMNGGNDERESTLNQLLVELDGVKENKIIFMAATNRPDMLDPALLRPGRLDRHITIDSYDLVGRTAILDIHARNKPGCKEIDLKAVAERTPGYSGAQLAMVCNEAAILASRRVRAASEAGEKIERRLMQADFFEAVDRVSGGAANGTRAKAMTDEDKKNVAYHEVGHAGLAEACLAGDGCTKLTILPRGSSLGHVQSVPAEDRHIWTEEQLRGRIIMALGGRASSELFLNSIDTGPSSDYNYAWEMARSMVVEHGMSPLGPMHLGQVELGDKLRNQIDVETQRIMSECMADAKRLLWKNREGVHRTVRAVIAHETLQGDEFRAIWGQKKKYKVNCRRTDWDRFRAWAGIL